MQNKLTQALGLGNIESLPEYNRLTEQILTDHLLYNRVMQHLVANYGPDIISEMHPLERNAFKKRLKYVPSGAAGIRIVWAFVSDSATPTQRAPLIRARRYFGNAPADNFEEQMFWRPQNVNELAAVKEPWTGSVPTPEVLDLYKRWLGAPDALDSLFLREQKLDQANAANEKQGKLTGDLAAAVNTQKVHDIGQFGNHEQLLHETLKATEACLAEEFPKGGKK